MTSEQLTSVWSWVVLFKNQECFCIQNYLVFYSFKTTFRSILEFSSHFLLSLFMSFFPCCYYKCFFLPLYLVTGSCLCVYNYMYLTKPILLLILSLILLGSSVILWSANWNCFTSPLLILRHRIAFSNLIKLAKYL